MTFTKKLICMLSVFAMLLSLTSCEMPMKIVGSIPDPKDTVTTFFYSVCACGFSINEKAG